MTNSRTADNAPLDDYVAAIVDLGGPLTGIVAHMERHPSSTAPIGPVLHQLLATTLEPLLRRCDAEQLEIAARVLNATAEIVCDEILLVPHVGSEVARSRGRRRRP